MHQEITVVLTSCNRFDLLETTLKSFFRYNTYPIEKFIIIEDSGNRKGLEKVLRKFDYDNFETIVNPEQLGQRRSIEIAYSHVKTPYIFHCEDDWVFLRPNFIEDSLKLMEAFPNIVTVWGRDEKELPDDFIAKEEHEYKGLRYKEVQKEIFVLNPSLKRMSDYKLMGGFTHFGLSKLELEISDFFKDRGYIAVILEEPFTTHLGWHRRVHFRDRANKFLFFDNKFKQAKAAVYKMLKMGKFKK